MLKLIHINTTLNAVFDPLIGNYFPTKWAVEAMGVANPAITGGMAGAFVFNMRTTAYNLLNTGGLYPFAGGIATARTRNLAGTGTTGKHFTKMDNGQNHSRPGGWLLNSPPLRITMDIGGGPTTT